MGHGLHCISAIADTSSGFYRGRACAPENWQFEAMTGGDWRQRIEDAAKRDGRSLRDISLAAGLSHGYLHGILRDDKEPTLDRFIRICQELNLSVAYALLGVQISPEAEKIVRLLENRPETRDAILALLPQS